jgi:hypothetical protein
MIECEATSDWRERLQDPRVLKARIGLYVPIYKNMAIDVPDKIPKLSQSY